MCPLARDKLAEARFFLSHLRRGQGTQPKYRYYASAAVSAARSVTLVLQSELRPAHGRAFDDWWRIAKQSLADRLRAFEVMRRARNAVLKHGNVILHTVKEREFADGPVSLVRLVENPSIGGGGDVQFEVRPGSEHGLTPLEDEYLAGMSRAQIDEIINAKVALLQDLGTKMRSIVHEEGDARYEITLGDPPVAYAQFVSELTSYLDALTELLDLADKAMAANLGLPPSAA